jgi:hypothetical protein
MGSVPPWWRIRRLPDRKEQQRRAFHARHDRHTTSDLAPNSTWTSIMSRTGPHDIDVVIDEQSQQISTADDRSAAAALTDQKCCSPARYRQSFSRVGLTTTAHDGTIASASTSLGEASAWIQATDLERRETPRVRTALPGLRVEPKWLPAQPDTPCSAKALTRGVPRPVHLPVPPHPVCNVLAPLCALAVRR